MLQNVTLRILKVLFSWCYSNLLSVSTFKLKMYPSTLTAYCLVNLKRFKQA